MNKVKAKASILFFVLSISIFNSQKAFTQVTITEISKSDPSFSGDLLFPIAATKTKKVADRVNQHLQEDMLMNASIILDSTAFDLSAFRQTDSSFQAGYTFMSYETGVNTASVWSVNFLVETMGAYPSGFIRYYNFNLNDGSIITIDQILDKKGKDDISKHLMKLREKKLENHLKEIKSETDAETFEYVKKSLADCNSDSDVSKFYLQAEGIIFYKDECLPHAVTAFEAPLNILIPYSQLSKNLTPLAKKIIAEIK